MISQQDKYEIGNMLELALKLQEAKNTMSDSGFCDQGDVEFIEQGTEQLEDLKSKYTLLD